MKSAFFLLPALALTACVSGGNNNSSVPATPVPNPPASNYPAPAPTPQAGGATPFDITQGWFTDLMAELGQKVEPAEPAPEH